MTQWADAKTVYAQSSDIKARSYLEYRKDMKKKAIAELETREWFEGKLKSIHQTDEVRVEKSGGDAHLWFSKRGGVSGAADYQAIINGQPQFFEFQYADSDSLPFYDFKVSKVGKKVEGKRIPAPNKQFLYIIKPTCQFAIFSPEWIMQNGNEAGVPAWGNRTAFRIPNAQFKVIFTEDESLRHVVETINHKNDLLSIQSLFIAGENQKFSHELQQTVDNNKAFEIIPQTLVGFYQSCFLVDKVEDYPKNNLLWLVYGTSFYSDDLNSYQFAQLMYALDFLFAGITQLQPHELSCLVDALKKCGHYIDMVQTQNLQTDKRLSPNEEVINFLFAVNVYEDMCQELVHTHAVTELQPIDKIFQSIHDIQAINTSDFAI